MNPIAWLQRFFSESRFPKAYFVIAVTIPLVFLWYSLFIRLPIMTEATTALKKSQRASRALNAEKQLWSQIETGKLKVDRDKAVETIPKSFADVTKWMQQLSNSLKSKGYAVKFRLGNIQDINADGIYLLPLIIEARPPLRSMPRATEGVLSLLDNMRRGMRNRKWAELTSLTVVGSGRGLTVAKLELALMVGFKE